MARKPRLWGLFVVGLVLTSSAVRAQGPSAAQIINYRPRMDDVVYSIPTPEELTQCKVESVIVNNRKIGWAVVDGKRQTLRRFLDTNGDNKIDVWSYYKDGVEVYREVDTKGTERPNQYRWFNDGGMKWGIDYSGKGKIDYWQQISADEVGHELFQALVTNSFERLQALFISEKEMSEAGLSLGEKSRIKDQLARAQGKFRDAVAKMKPGSKFIRVESSPPFCVSGDTLKMDIDLIHYPTRPILYEVPGTAKTTLDWVQSGEIIQVGLRWRLADGPGDGPVIVTNSEADWLQKEIAKLDAAGPVMTVTTKKELDTVMMRVGLIDKLLPLLPPAERESWIRQMLDNLTTAAVADAAPMTRLGQVEAQLVKGMPGASITGHAVYCKLNATWMPYMSGMNLPKDVTMKDIQDKWHVGLTSFVQGYPNCDDTPEALRQLANVCEYTGKEEEAKRWYTQLYTNFPGNPNADMAKGSVRRLECIGQPMELTAAMLNGPSTPFSITQLKGKVVAIYYWTTRYSASNPRDFAELKRLHASQAGKGFEVVCVNLDDDPADAARFVSSNPLPGIHLYQQGKNAGGGLNGPLATQYGINVLPTLFLIGRDGRVANRSLDVSNLEDALKKLP